MWDGYLDFGGTEIINTARATAYARGAGLPVQCTECETLHLALDDEPYTAPHLDTAPWYDTSQPESGQFFGVMGMGVEGLGRPTLDRTPVPLIGEGSIVSVVRRGHREVGFSVSLLARGDRGLSYGIEWLAAALQGASCTPTGGSCRGHEMCMFTACPTEIPIGLDPNSCAPGAGTGTITEDDTGALGTAELRHMYDAALLEGPTPVNVRQLGGDFRWAEYTFTMVVGKPWIFREPVATTTDWVPLGGQPIVGPVDPDAVYAECPVDEPCLQDPTCPVPPLPPAPPVPTDPCYPGGGAAMFRRALLEVDPLAPPDWLEMVPVIEVSTGAEEMRRLIIRFWTSNESQPCSDLADPCNACLDLQVSYLPRGALLLLDGRTQRASVGCPQGDDGYIETTPQVFGSAGRLFTWPVFPCPTGLCVEVMALASSVSSTAQVRVRMVPRSDAA